MLFSILNNAPLTLILVLAGGCIASYVPDGTGPKRGPAQNEFTRPVVLITSMSALLIGTMSCLSFDKSAVGFQFLSTARVLPEYNLTFSVGADGLTMVFLLLTLFIFPICILSV